MRKLNNLEDSNMAVFLGIVLAVIVTAILTYMGTWWFIGYMIGRHRWFRMQIRDLAYDPDDYEDDEE
jgi:hypothetical protein